MKKFTLYAAASLFLFCSCDSFPSNENEHPCIKLSKLRIDAVTPITKGGTFTLNANNIEAVYYSWEGPYGFSSNDNNITISDANFKNRGWYYLDASHVDCPSRVDSEYVEVKFPQGVPACKPDEGKAIFNDVVPGTIDFYSVSVSNKGASCSGQFGDIKIQTHPYWAKHDLEDGIYLAKSNHSFEVADIDVLNFRILNGILWHPEEGQQVYVSHVGGKIRFTLCELKIIGFGDNAIHTTLTMQITQK